nr:hypothetical protein [Tanacetum cinerariifolium]
GAPSAENRGKVSENKGKVSDKNLTDNSPTWSTKKFYTIWDQNVSVSHDHGVNPPHIDECCCECGEALDGIICQRCAFKSCGKAPKVLLLALDRVSKIKDAFKNNQYKPKDIQELFRKLLDDLQNIHEELAEFINSPSWNRPAVYEDDDDAWTTPLQSHPSYPPRSRQLSNLEVEKIVIPEDEEIEDDNLREKLLKVNLLIDENEALKDNPTPSFEFLTKSSSTSPKFVLEGINTFHNSLPEFENFCFDLEEISSGSTTTHSNVSLSEYEAFSFYDDHIKEIRSGSNISLPKYDSFIFDLLNDQFPPSDRSDFTHKKFGDEPDHIISPPEYDCFYFGNLPDPVEDDYSPLLAYVVWIFLAFHVSHYSSSSSFIQK